MTTIRENAEVAKFHQLSSLLTIPSQHSLVQILNETEKKQQICKWQQTMNNGNWKRNDQLHANQNL